jgi:hypothetical protein
VKVNDHTYKLIPILKNAALTAVLQTHKRHYNLSFSAKTVTRLQGSGLSLKDCVIKGKTITFDSLGDGDKYDLRVYRANRIISSKKLAAYLFNEFGLDTEVSNHRFEFEWMRGNKYKIILDI